ncbi:MAG: arsenosugar biosynthesis radical SAM (seleno)protein ArsS [Planctomycetota bacterium]|jgi:radical SAM/Cys-rich protein
MTVDFRKELENIDPRLLCLDELQTLQVNLGNLCNQSCVHCHVQAGPNGKKTMSRQTMGKIIEFLTKHPDLVADITGGCPELNPDFKFFVDSICGVTSSVMVRTNLTVFIEPTLSWVPKWYSEKKVVLMVSLPCYTEENVDDQRGAGAFKKSITALRMLNDLGYGVNSLLQMNLVHNPGGEFLPGPQEQLEVDYKRELYEKYQVRFDRLFTITNAPIGRFRRHLETNGRLEQYQRLLVDNFNPDAAKNIMCRRLISIGYDGTAYNCDLNQAMGLPITDSSGQVVSIELMEDSLPQGIELITGDHCFCCTAGAGLSCTGSLVG